MPPTRCFAVLLGLTCLFGAVAACGPNARGDLVDGGGDDDDDPCVGPECSSACGASGVELVYVVDDAHRLLSFDPTALPSASALTVLGTLSCPAGPAIEIGGTATPFSMSVDRNAIAWVLYTSGQIFKVPVDGLSCTDSGFTPRQQSMDLFGMGFVTDTAGGNTEKLFIAGGDTAGTPGGQLGVVDPVTLGLTLRGAVRADTEYSPELTGTGAAKLFGFYPGISETFVQEFDKGTGAGTGSEFSIPGGLGGGDPFSVVRAWAFAQWGGVFYLFVTTEDLSGITNSTVRTIDPSSGATATVLSNLPYIIVGAGVSTCAPVEIE